MAFEGLSERLQGAMTKIGKKGKITEADLKEMMREVRLALLEADVNFKVVKEFVKKVNERALGSDVLESLSPTQQVIKIVNEELTELMGGQQEPFQFSAKPPTVVMLVGLQGAGKTTTAGKLANYMKKKKTNARCWSQPTSIVLQQSISCRPWANNWISRCMHWVPKQIRSI